MGLFSKNIISEELDILPLIPDEVSETIAKRDSFFHSCWVALKYRRPDIWDEMTKVELYISGYEDPALADEKKDEQSDDATIL
jgi:hypothetical protein